MADYYRYGITISILFISSGGVIMDIESINMLRIYASGNNYEDAFIKDHFCIFVVHFDSLAEASDFRIERGQVAGLPGKPFKPFLTFSERKTFFLPISVKRRFSLFSCGLQNCPKMHFSELIFAKHFLGEVPQTPTCGIESPPIPSTCAALYRVAWLCAVPSHQIFSSKMKKPKEKISG